MAIPVALRAVIEALDMQGDLSNAYLNRSSAETLMLSHEEIEMAQTMSPEELAERPEREREVIAQATKVRGSADYLKLPGKFELHEWRMMEKFCHAHTDRSRQEALLDAIHARGAFRRFKNALDASELNEWYYFREAEFSRLARNWLESNRIAYQPD
jgi:hypothetical protein